MSIKLTRLTNAHELYVERQAAVADKLVALKQKLETHSQREAADPKNWGFCGDLAHIEQVLDELLEFA